MQVIEKNKGSKLGRPSDYREEFDIQAENLALLGATDEDLARAFDVSEVTINAWKNVYPSFLNSLKKGREAADAKVASRLYKRALGYSHEDIDIRAVSVGNNGGSEIVQTPIVKHYPPDTTAAIFWLKNRRPQNWRDTKLVELNVQGEITHSVDDLRKQLQGEVIDVHGHLIPEQT